MAKNIKKKGWHDYKYGGVHERRLYGKHGKVLAKVPIKRATKKRKK